ncbi:MAG: tRNA glutamyl-Q(34) synthetase GluQRS [Aestuariivita sp.]|nr:tRNA glutamyl-Q(34) synthetase GluQRS [Aestuariivita sp.]
MTFVTRFAPSPTGPLHLGHAYSALLTFDMARNANGEVKLRIEDLDQSRSRMEWEQHILADLDWLNLIWSPPLMRQSKRGQTYEAALRYLWSKGLLYPCTCSRRDIAAAVEAPQEGVDNRDSHVKIYPGTCRPPQPLYDLPFPKTPVTLRLNMELASADLELSFTEYLAIPKTKSGEIKFGSEQLKHEVGDIVLSRRDFTGSYHLSVVIDDAEQGVTDVVRGRDLYPYTKIHVLLQRLLDLPTPKYHHHDLIRDQNGKRLAKRNNAYAISKYREEGASPTDIRMIITESLERYSDRS